MGANRGRNIAVIGGGIGGLTAALAFAQRGAQVSVFEKATALTDVGAGLQITPNGMCVLGALGLSDAIADRAVRAAAVVPVNGQTGRQVARFDLRGTAYYFLHRADLIDILANACISAGVNIMTDAAVTSASNGIVYLENGTEHPAHLIVGADGLHSATRRMLNDTSAPFFTGQVAWRAVITHPSAAEARIWMMPGRHVVTYPLRGGRLNIVAVQARDAWADEGWNHAGDPANLTAAFEDACPALCNILDHVETPSLWGLFRHPIASIWAANQVAILGDAAHPTLPFLAQGANLAIEDSYVLARVCDADASLDRALGHYKNLRQPRVTQAIAAANANATNYHLSGAKRAVAHLGLSVMGAVAPTQFLNRLGWLYDHDVTA